MSGSLSTTSKVFMIVASALLLSGVILGAIGSHALPLDQGDLNSWELAVQYQLIHSLGLILIAMLYEQRHQNLLRWVGVLMIIGMLFFSVSIYLTKLGAPAAIGRITPWGGSTLMLGWLLFGIAILRR